jgi:acyl-CoA hydrolase
MSAPATTRAVDESRVEMTQIVMPGHANALHTAFGGTVMSWVDVCAAISAQRHARSSVDTASIDSVHFVEPIRLGQVVVLRGQVNKSWKSSMEVGVRIETEDPRTGVRRHALTAYLTFVALDGNGLPTAVPAVSVTNAEDERRQVDAERRRQSRLADRQRRAERLAAR